MTVKVQVLGVGSRLGLSVAALIASLPQCKVEVIDTVDTPKPNFGSVGAIDLGKQVAIQNEREWRGGSRKKGGRYKWPRR
jgi:hypothetical protein